MNLIAIVLHKKVNSCTFQMIRSQILCCFYSSVLPWLQMVIDALLLCFCEDTAMNDGVTPGKEYYMNASLMVGEVPICVFDWTLNVAELCHQLRQVTMWLAPFVGC